MFCLQHDPHKVRETILPEHLFGHDDQHWYHIFMPNIQRSRVGRAFTLEEHQEVFGWNNQDRDKWPRIELALNYPNTPEILGVIECGQVGPTFFVWAADWGIIVEPISGGSFTYPNLRAAFNAISLWMEIILRGKRVPFGTSPDKF